MLGLGGTTLAGLLGYFALRMRVLSLARRLRWWSVGLCGGMAAYMTTMLVAESWWRLPAMAAGVAFLGTAVLMIAVWGVEALRTAKSADNYPAQGVLKE